MKRTIKYIPEIAGCYGMRIWVPASDKALVAFILPICVWHGATDQRFVLDKLEYCFELPFGINENTLWQQAYRYFNIEFVR